MSKRRNVGEWVRPGKNTGFVAESDRLPAQIQPEEEECREWATLFTAPDPLDNGIYVLTLDYNRYYEEKGLHDE